jgi:small-conductance mechanosensitive channel
MDKGFLGIDSDLFGATITIAVAIVIAYLVDRIVLARGGRLAGQVTDVGVSRAAATRLRVVRRLVFVTIVVLGVGLALSQFTQLGKIATGLLASSAVLGIILGLAARQVLANPLAGILLAITQPIRIGDTITLDDETGRVDDLTLSYTYIDTGDGRLMIVPNEQVVTQIVFNRSTGDQNAPVAASVWLPPGGDIARARAALAPLEASDIETVEITPDGVRLLVHGPHGTARTSVSGEEAALRERAHQLLLGAGLLGADAE